MSEIFIIKTNESEKIKNFLNEAGVSYEVYQEPQKVDIFANYDKAIKNPERERELAQWDNADLDEQLNNDGEWWS